MKTPTTPTPTQAALARFLLPGLLALAKAMLVGALMFTAPNADAQTPGKAANARPAAEQSASTNQPGKDTTDAATATKPPPKPVPETPEEFAEWLGQKRGLDAQKQAELTEYLKNHYESSKNSMYNIVGAASMFVHETSEHMIREGWSPDVYSSPEWLKKEAAAPRWVYGYGEDFSDGVAWVSEDSGPPNQQWNCIDKTGKVILKLGRGESPRSDFSKGVALVQRLNILRNGLVVQVSDGILELIDKSGKVISSPKSGEYDRIIGFILEEGMIVVRKHIDTFEGTEDRYGTIDSLGKWKLSLSKDRTYLISKRFGYNGEGLEYIGEGFIEAASERLYYNVLTGDSIEEPGYSMQGMDNGHGVFLVNDQAAGWGLYTIDIKGQKTKLMSDSHRRELGRYKNGLFYYGDLHRYDNRDGLLYNHLGKLATPVNSGEIQGLPGGFYDIKGNLIIDLSRYRIDEIPEFSGEYCLLSLLNPQGSRYFTVIDKKGTQMFEPRRRAPGQKLSINCGLIVVKNDDRTTSVINTSGETIVNLGQAAVSNYREDVAMVKNNGIIYYIDKKGRRLGKPDFGKED